LALVYIECRLALLAYPVAAGSVLFGAPGGPEPEGNDKRCNVLDDLDLGHRQ